MVSTPLILSILLIGLVPGPAATSDDAVSRLSLAPPSLVDERAFPTRTLGRSLSASGVTIIDLQSGQELYGWNAAERRPIGSLTKIMTAIIIAESHHMDEIVAVPQDIALVDGNAVRLPAQAHFTVGDMLSALLMASANDAAAALAQFHSGSDETFVRLMNERARALGLRDTAFANPTGLDDDRQWSTPRDIAWLASYALRNADIRQRMSKMRLTIRSREGDVIALEHTHELLGRRDVVAGKTGTTTAARQCLLSVVREKGREYLVVLLGSSERYVDLEIVLRILNHIFA